jgi:hypothetical protein
MQTITKKFKGMGSVNEELNKDHDEFFEEEHC